MNAVLIPEDYMSLDVPRVLANVISKRRESLQILLDLDGTHLSTLSPPCMPSSCVGPPRQVEPHLK
jgi:hypothetical protein